MKIDYYTKIILTIIAIALVGLLFHPVFLAQKLEADPVQYVIIKNGWLDPVPVVVTNMPDVIEVSNFDARALYITGEVQVSNSPLNPLCIEGSVSTY